jgi:hypothetical protein
VPTNDSSQHCSQGGHDARRHHQADGEVIEPFRVTPGSKVTLGKDFDSAFRAGIDKKKDGVGLLNDGIGLLAEYQRRLAAESGAGWWCSRRSTRRGRTGPSVT